jgi:surface carbohydrate biosynthesis protein (TIGR04326 family)
MSNFSEDSEVGGTLLVRDGGNTSLMGNNEVVLWSDFSPKDGSRSVSIPSLVEENADLFKSRYLSWIYDLGEKKIKEKRVSDILELRPGLNYWWLTLIIEKSNYGKSPQIDNVIKFLAFEEWAKDKAFDRLVLSSHNNALSESMSLWCARKGISFEWQKVASNPVRNKSYKSYIYHLLPKPIQAFVWFINYLIRRWPLRGIGIDEWRQTKAKVVIVSYLFNLSPKYLIRGKFKSNYWTLLPNKLLGNECKTNWLHIYIEDSLLPTAKHAARALSRFNTNHNPFQTHVTLDTFLNLRIIIRVLLDWANLVRKGKGLSSIFAYEDIMWPLIKEDWKESLIGKSAISSLLEYNLMESAIDILPRQNKGVYLQENQGWEFGFIQLWKKRKNGILIGAPHSTVRYWDLRYFFDTRHYYNSNLNSLPLPDKVAVNGFAAKQQYLQGGYPENAIVNVEALRYFHLSETISKCAKNNFEKSKFSILLLLDYLDKNIEYQLSLLCKSLDLLTYKAHLIVKPHPANPINVEDYPELEMEITSESIASCMCKCDVVFTSNSTSAAVDAYCLGGRVIVVNDPHSLNQSPLRGIQSVYFVSTAKDLVNVLSNIDEINQKSANKNDFFYFDQNLTKWCKQLL